MCATIYVVDVNECDFAPCKNNGTCINNNGSYVCECIHGWQGQHCDDGRIRTKIAFYKLKLIVITNNY